MTERRLTLYLLGIAFLTLLLILGAYSGWAYLGRGSDENAWVRQNEAILAMLPLYPGAVTAGDSYTTGEPDPTAKHKNANGGPYRGYWTTDTFTLPPATTPYLVLSFYNQRLGGWTAQPVAGSSCESKYRSGRAQLDVKVCDGRLTLSVDYQEYEA